MHTPMQDVIALVPRSSRRRTSLLRIVYTLFALFFLPLVFLSGVAIDAQTADLITRAVNPADARTLKNHHPLWAAHANDAGAVPADLPMENVTMVLARSGQQEQAFEQLLKDQQDPSSPAYHQWLTPTEIGERYGLSDDDIVTITAWMRSQGLRVDWVSPSRTLIGFGGTAADVNRAFQTTLHYYNVNGRRRMSVASDPMIPAALAPVIQSVRGLFTIDEHPFHRAAPMQSNAPGMTVTSGSTTYHFVAPADFATIYDVPSSVTGVGTTIGIVAESRTDMADFTNFKSRTGSTFTNPTEVIPTAYGGVDPGAAYTSPPSCVSTNNCSSAVTALLDDQSEATLDVLRAGSTAPGASLLLVVATSASGGIGADTEYLVETTPVPAQVISISFGACEYEAGSSGVAFWNNLFQLAAGEGISVFVASGDSGASGCDTYFATPPASPYPNSPNYICSPGYATCVGGTEFNDTASPSTYWSSTNGTGLLSVLSYIPEGAWNEPLNSSSNPQAAASGGGVSSYVVTPSWQTGTGVPSARAGRYTPDVAFSSSGHDGYFACFAAGSGSCVTSGNSYSFEIFAGTSAAAPSMAGVAALLNQHAGTAQGNLNPGIYNTAANTPAVFHDVTVATSGVTGCAVTTPSMCNNSIPSPTGLTGGQSGYLVGIGYDEVTGWGSLDVAQFINNYTNVAKITPTVSATPVPNSVTTTQSFQLQVTVSGGNGNPTPTGTVTVVNGSTSWGPTTLTSGSANINFAAGSLPVGLDTLMVSYTPDTTSSSTYATTSGSTTINVTSTTKTTPTITWATPAAITYGTALSATQLNATASVAGSFTYAPTAGTVLTAGQQTLTAYFTPTDTTDYNTATATVTLTVNKATPVITWATPAAISYGTALSATQLNATASVPGSFTYAPVAGTVLTAGQQTLTANFVPADTVDYNSTSANVTLIVNKAVPSISWATPLPITYGTALSAAQLDASTTVAGSFIYTPPIGTVLTAGQQTLTGNFTPADTTDYTTATATATLTVNKATPVITWATPAAITYGTALSATQLNATASVPGSFTYSPAAGTLLTAGQQTLTANFTPADTTDYNTVSSNVTLTVNKATPVITWATPAAITYGTALSSTQLNATASVPGTFTYSPAAGTVLAVGQQTLTANFTPTDTTDYNTATASVTLTVNAVTTPTFGITGTSVTVTRGATTGNTSTITVTPANGFTGSVSLTASVTSSPSGAQYAPTLSFGSTSPVPITGTSAGTATLTISTTAATANLEYPTHPAGRWYATGGSVLACVLLFWLPVRRRAWRNLLGIVALLVVLTCGVLACGGGSSSSSGGGGISGTTPGSYTITVTGTSGSLQIPGSVSLTVQ